MRAWKRALAIAFALLALGLAACSPEDGRRAGERGADVGNRPDEPAEVELHGKSDPSHDVPTKLPGAGKAQTKK